MVVCLQLMVALKVLQEKENWKWHFGHLTSAYRLSLSELSRDLRRPDL